MHSISAPHHPLPNCFNHFHVHHLIPHSTKKFNLQSFPKRNVSHSRNPSSIPLAQAHSYIKPQERRHKSTESDPYHNPSLVLQFFSSTGNNSSQNLDPEAQIGENEEEQGDGETKNAEGLFTNMWWADLKAALGQRFNTGVIVCAVGVVVRDHHLCLIRIILSPRLTR